MKIKASVFFSFLEIEIGESDHQDAMIDDAYSTMSIYSHSREFNSNRKMSILRTNYTFKKVIYYS